MFMHLPTINISFAIVMDVCFTLFKWSFNILYFFNTFHDYLFFTDNLQLFRGSCVNFHFVDCSFVYVQITITRQLHLYLVQGPVRIDSHINLTTWWNILFNWINHLTHLWWLNCHKTVMNIFKVYLIFIIFSTPSLHW